MTTQTFRIADDESGERLDKFLAARLPDLSRGQLQDLIKSGGVLVNSKSGKPALRLAPGDSVQVSLPKDAPETPLQPEDIALDVLHEDDALVVIHKPAGLVVHPAPGNESGTLVNALLARYPDLGADGAPERAGIVHRLDKDTSGVILVARTAAAQAHLMAQFQERTVHKTYWALCERQPRTESGRIDAPIGRDPRQRKRMAVVHSGKPAVTEYHTLDVFEDHTLLAAHPETGRTHQVRVHLAFIGCPVVGDRVYGPRKQRIKLSRLFLHAQAITIRHPARDEALTFEAPLPPKLQNVLQQLAEQRES
ncbi:MAG: RluA family pseudouridine synthase [Anaerolineales bacterium]